MKPHDQNSHGIEPDNPMYKTMQERYAGPVLGEPPKKGKRFTPG